MPSASIQDIITSLTAIVQQCELNNNRAGYFAALYKRMTIAVSDGINKTSFEGWQPYAAIGCMFANRYLIAWAVLRSKQPCCSIRQFAFDGCSIHTIR